MVHEKILPDQRPCVKYIISLNPARQDDTDNQRMHVVVDAVLVAVGDALRLEGAQAERAKLDCNSPNWKDGWQTRDAEDGFIRQEAADAERERLVASVETVRAKYEPDGDGNRWLHDGEVLEALGGVHPEASDG